jgi:hypothetical protein
VVAPVDPDEEEIERVAQLMDDLARPIFVLRAARGLLSANATSTLPGADGQSRGARTRQRNAAAQIIELIDAYVREE